MNFRFWNTYLNYGNKYPLEVIPKARKEVGQERVVTYTTPTKFGFISLRGWVFFQFSGPKIVKYTRDETFEHEQNTFQINSFSVMQKHFSGKDPGLFFVIFI